MARVSIEVPVEQPSEAPKQAPAPNQQQPTHAPVPPPSNFPLKKVVIIGAIIIGIFFVFNLMQDRNRLQQELDGKGGSAQTAEIVKVLSRTIELPMDEVPESRTIEDASKFTEQNPSLSDIRNGDMLLFFPKSQKVVVYRPATKKAVVVVKLAQPSSTQESAEPQN